VVLIGNVIIGKATF